VSTSNLKALAAEVRAFWSNIHPKARIVPKLSEPGSRLLAAVDAHECPDVAELVAALREALDELEHRPLDYDICEQAVITRRWRLEERCRAAIAKHGGLK
jgi:hypothetical protein